MGASSAAGCLGRRALWSEHTSSSVTQEKGLERLSPECHTDGEQQGTAWPHSYRSSGSGSGSGFPVIACKGGLSCCTAGKRAVWWLRQ